MLFRTATDGYKGTKFHWVCKGVGVACSTDVKKHLFGGKIEVIDVVISKYFDTIPHDKLMQLVAKYIVDKHILGLIKMWLKAPIV